MSESGNNATVSAPRGAGSVSELSPNYIQHFTFDAQAVSHEYKVELPAAGKYVTYLWYPDDTPIRAELGVWIVPRESATASPAPAAPSSLPIGSSVAHGKGFVSKLRTAPGNSPGNVEVVFRIQKLEDDSTPVAYDFGIITITE